MRKGWYRLLYYSPSKWGDVFLIGRRHVSERGIPPLRRSAIKASTGRGTGGFCGRDDRVGKIAGTYVTSGELPFWLERGVRYFCVHSDPLLRAGLAGAR